ncbi:hypothetical protein CLAN_1004 [Campylobacter lanienae NCTC 13004]|uniref:Uncharacterized protein n=1 Tax=Campylobacter lanienae NCTC 13004 TaxID=1031753 RepID=A0A1X9SNC5_9BACT|nr:hypothetical protein [Campylobacter lanienae]ARQ97741.1 hypothetical protein CLAN_1004 [Campylobacter lanienae NCTC 13004]
MKLSNLLPFLAENQKDFKAHFAIGGGDSKDAKLPLKIFLNGKFNDDQDLQTQKTLNENIYFLFAI